MQEKSDKSSNFLDRFRYLMRRHDLSISSACRAVGISRSLYYEIHEGRREVTSKMVDRLAEAERRYLVSDASKATTAQILQEVNRSGTGSKFHNLMEMEKPLLIDYVIFLSGEVERLTKQIDAIKEALE